MTTTLVVPIEPGAALVGNKNAAFEAWTQTGEKLFQINASINSAHEKSQWDIGDWLVRGEEEFGNKAYPEAERITGLQRESLYNVVWVVKKFRTISLRSETKLKWSHFKELARIPDQAVREERLHQLNDGFEHSVLDVRTSVDTILRKLKENNGSKNDKPSKAFVTLQVSLTSELRDRVKSYAKQRERIRMPCFARS